MALNCSSPSLLLGDDCSGKMLGCGCWSEEVSPLSSCGVGSLCWDELDLELEFEDDEEEETEESDPIARLPSDPFEMNLGTTTSAMAALAWCIEDITARSGGYSFESGGSNDFIVNLLNHTFVAFAPNPSVDGDIGFSEGSFGSKGPSGGDPSQFSWLPSNASCSQTSQFVENASNSQCGVLELRDVGAACSGFGANQSSSQDATLAYPEVVGTGPQQEGHDAHPGMLFAVGYLGLRDILSCEMVCKSFHLAVRSDMCSWRCIHIDSQLGEKICDADILRLTQKSPGDLHCLSLVRCKNITDQGLKAVLQSNPQLTELGIFGNVRITHQGLIDSLRSFNLEATNGIKKLRVANLATLTQEQYEELLSLLKIDMRLALHKQEPRIFHADCFLSDHHGGYAPDCLLPDLHDQYVLDIERCPLCEKYKLVFDCPAEGCKNSRSGKCRGCLVCIQRCLRCGGCIDSEYEETFSLDNLCRSCQMDRDSIAEK